MEAELAVMMNAWASLSPFRARGTNSSSDAVTILKSCEPKVGHQKGKKKNNVLEFLTLMCPARLQTDDIHQAPENLVSTHNPGYALRSFPLYTFLSRGGYFYILTLGNHDECSEESILGQTKPVSASVATHTPPPPPGRPCHFSPGNYLLRWSTPHVDATQQNSLRL